MIGVLRRRRRFGRTRRRGFHRRIQARVFPLDGVFAVLVLDGAGDDVLAALLPLGLVGVVQGQLMQRRNRRRLSRRGLQIREGVLRRNEERRRGRGSNQRLDMGLCGRRGSRILET